MNETSASGSTPPRHRRATGPSELLLAQAHQLSGAERQAVLDRVVADNLDLARRLAARYYGRGEAQDDLEQVATVGLILAVRRFDPSVGVSIADFATPTILGELRRHFRDKGWVVRPPRSLQELRPRLRAAQLDLEQELSRRPTAAEVAAELGLTVAQVGEIELASTGYSPASLEHPVRFDGSTTTLGDMIADEADDVAAVETRLTVDALLAELTPRQRRIVELRYFAEMTQRQIAVEIGVSQVQVSRLLAQILVTLRAGLDRAAGSGTVAAT